MPRCWDTPAVVARACSGRAHAPARLWKSCVAPGEVLRVNVVRGTPDWLKLCPGPRKLTTETKIESGRQDAAESSGQAKAKSSVQ